MDFQSYPVWFNHAISYYSSCNVAHAGLRNSLLRRTTMNKLDLIKAHLAKLGTDEIKAVYPYNGICEELVIVFNVHIYKEVFSDWPMYTGRECFPVPHPDKTPLTAFCGVGLGQRIDKWVGIYGDNRRDLCIWLSINLTEANYRVLGDKY